MFEPLIIGTKQFNELSSDQQKALEDVGKGLQDYAYKSSEEDDKRVEDEFKKNGVKIGQMSDSDFKKWQEASTPVWDSFAKDVDGGRELVDLAKQISQG